MENTINILLWLRLLIFGNLPADALKIFEVAYTYLMSEDSIFIHFILCPLFKFSDLS